MVDAIESDEPIHGAIVGGVEAVSIVDQVFGAFADALATQPERADVAGRLRNALITNGVRSEGGLRAALFGASDA